MNKRIRIVVRKTIWIPIQIFLEWFDGRGVIETEYSPKILYDAVGVFSTSLVECFSNARTSE